MKLLNLYLKFSTKKTKPIKIQSFSSEFQKHKSLFLEQKICLQQENKTLLPSQTKPNILITAALPYVNNVPHLGNIIGALLSADVFARYKRLLGENVLFIGGTDEYGTATEVKAKLQKKTPKEICDIYHVLHKEIYDWFQISYNHFGRTSSIQHTQIVQQIFKQGHKNNLFVQKNVTQLFCNSCDMFLADRFVTGECSYCNSQTKGDQCQSCNKIFHSPQNQIKNIKCAICNSKPQIKESKHLFINFEKNPQLRQKLNNWLFQQKTIDRWTNNAKGNTKSWINDKLKDRCITRDLKWGVPVPLQSFKDKVFYVWFDAPLGYISMTKQLLGQNYKKWWINEEKQAQNQNKKVKLYQFMGKDNIIFHSITSPYCLLATGKDYILPYNLNVTQYLQYEGGKFSKSKNLGVFGNQCKQTQIQSDIWRYYLLSSRPQHFDSQFTWQQFMQKNNKELSNSIGNLYNRILKNSYNFNGYDKKIPKLDISSLRSEDQLLIENFGKAFEKYIGFLDKCMLKSGVEMLLEMSFILNKYIQDTQFWKNQQRKPTIIEICLRGLCCLGHFMQPYLPTTSARIYYLLGIQNLSSNQVYKQAKQDFKNYFINCMNESRGIKQPILLFKMIQQDKMKEFKLKYGSNKIQKLKNEEEQLNLKIQKNKKLEDRKHKKQQKKKNKEENKKTTTVKSENQSDFKSNPN